MQFMWTQTERNSPDIWFFPIFEGANDDSARLTIPTIFCEQGYLQIELLLNNHWFTPRQSKKQIIM